MGLYQSYLQCFVTNSPAILAEGQTVDSLAVGQIGILDAKTYKAVTAPTYAKNKALYAVWGTPDVTLGDFGGVPNENEYSKMIKGKNIKSFRATKAQRGQTPVYTIGWSGDVSDTDTLFAKVGESKNLFIKLTGYAIDRLYSKQGIIKEFITTPACFDDCTDTCGMINCKKLATELVDQINSDKDFNKYIRAKSIIECTPSTPIVETDCYKFKLDICDTGDARSLGMVQAQYPDEKIVRIGRYDAVSTYGVVKIANTAPVDYEGGGLLVPDCPICPTGGTLLAESKVFEVRVASEAAAPTVPGQIAAILLSKDPQYNTYEVLVGIAQDEKAVVDAVEALGGVATLIGTKRNICEMPPVVVAWVANGTLKKTEKKYRITLADSICGTNRLVNLQTAYPDLVISVVNSAGNCVHTYETTVKSNCYEVGCAISSVTFVKPSIFEGAEWVEVPVAVDPTAECKCGIQIETAFVNRNTTECTFDSFPYENDIVHVQISNYNPDYNGDSCEMPWVVKQIRQVKYPQGDGRYVQHLEKKSKMYDQRFRSSDAVVREAQNYSLQADPTKFYDEYVLNFDTTWKTSGGWAENYTQSFDLVFFVPEGTGTQLENTLNTYVTSAGVEENGCAI